MIDQKEYDTDVEVMACRMFERVMSIKFAGGSTLLSREATQIATRCIETSKLFAETLISTGLNTYQIVGPHLVEEVIPYPSAKEVKKQVGEDNAKRNK